MKTTVQDIDLVKLYPHPNNPRKALGDLTDLTASIREHGVRQPVTVVPEPGTDGEYRVVMGHRRAEASRLAGLTTVPAIIDPDLSESQQLVLMGHENIQRSQLTPVEEGDWLQAVLDIGHVKRSNLPRVTGMAKTTVSSRLKLAHLPDAAKTKVHEGQATLEEALQLADADLPADVVEDLTARLGTPSFRWEIENARRAAKAAADRAKVRACLEEAGVTWSDNKDGIDVTQWGFHSRVDLETDLADLPEGCMAVPGHWGSEVNIYRPLTADETATALAEIEERNRLLEARKSEPTWEERQEARRALIEPMNVARALRVEFLTPYTTGAKLLTPGQSTAVFDELVLGLGTLSWAKADQFAWLDLGRSTPLTRQERHALVLAPEGRDRLALAALAAKAEGDPASDHADIFGSSGIFWAARTEDGWGSAEPILNWYALLEHIGYLPSEWENERLSLGLPDLTEDDVEDGESGD